MSTEPPSREILNSDAKLLNVDDGDVEVSGESLEKPSKGLAQRLCITETPGVQPVTVRWENLSQSIRLALPKILDWLRWHRDTASSVPATLTDVLESVQNIFCVRCFHINRNVVVPQPYCQLCQLQSFFWQNWATEIAILEQLSLHDSTMMTAGADVARAEGDVFYGLPPPETLDGIFSNLRGDSVAKEPHEAHQMMDRQRQQQQKALVERTAKVDRTKHAVKVANSKRTEAEQATNAAIYFANEATKVAIETEKAERITKQANKGAKLLKEVVQVAMETANAADNNAKMALETVRNAKRAEDDARKKEAAIAAKFAKVVAHVADKEVSAPNATPTETLTAATIKDPEAQLLAENAQLLAENARLRAEREAYNLEIARLRAQSEADDLDLARLRAQSEADDLDLARLLAQEAVADDLEKAWFDGKSDIKKTGFHAKSEELEKARLWADSKYFALDKELRIAQADTLETISRYFNEKALRLTAEAEFLDNEAKQLAAGAASQTYVSAQNVALHVKDVSIAFRELNCLISELGTLGNETVRGTSTGSGFTVDTQRFDDTNYSTAVNRTMELVDIPGKMCLDEWVEELKDPESNKDLDDFHAFLNDGFRAAKASNVETLKYQTIDQIHSWRTFIGSENKPKTFYIPAGSSKEVKGWQPLLDAIVFEIGMIVKGDHSIASHQKIAGFDILVNGMSEHLRVVIPFMISCPIEVKPPNRKSQSPTKNFDEGYHRIVGLLAKKLHFLLHFGGIGIDGNFTGGVLSLGGFQLVSLETTSVGSANPNLELNRSSLIPLFDDATTKHLFHLLDVAEKANNQVVKDGDGSNKGVDSNTRRKGNPKRFQEESNTEDCRMEQCGSTHREGSGDQERLTDMVGKQAFRAIAHLLLDSVNNQDLFTSRGKIFVTEADGRLMELTKDSYMGAGLLCCVYRLDRSHVVKIPKSYRASPSLLRERKTLEALKQDSTGCIPKLLCPGKVVFEVRCERSELGCLVIQGLIGKPSSQVISSDIPVLEAIYWNVRTALLSAHKKNIIHLDIKPSNIIYDVNEDTGDIRVQLIDWGCAAATFEAFSGFRGSMPFAHDVLLHEKENDTEMQPRAVMDWASLTYTMATLLNGSEGKAPWWGFYDSNVLQDYLDRRNILARYLISESGLSEEIKKNLLNAIPCPKQLSVGSLHVEKMVNHYFLL